MKSKIFIARTKSNTKNEANALSAIKAMPLPYRDIGMILHSIIKTAAPSLSPKTWYGMPAYANTDGKIICFFRGGDKFKERYMTLGFNDSARLDEGSFWPIAFALTKLSPAEKNKITALVKKALG